jgi:hypothetical protein
VRYSWCECRLVCVIAAGAGGRGDVSVFMLRCARHTHTHTHTQRYTADATSSNENKSFHIADGRRGARGRARQHLHTRPLCDTVMLKWETCTANAADSARTLPRMNACKKRSVLICDDGVAAKTYCFSERAPSISFTATAFLCSHFYKLQKCTLQLHFHYAKSRF